jgi:hypothetical protein
MKIKLVFILINGLNLYGKFLYFISLKYISFVSKRLAPGGWTQSTKDNAITVRRRYLPFWNLSLYGSVNASIKLQDNTTTKVSLI